MELLQREERSSVIEVGAGVGKDGAALIDAGFKVSAIDLSAGNVEACRSRGIDAHVASALDLPFDDDRFDAGFTMSTLLHMPDESLGMALEELTRVVKPGAPAAIGLWGGVDRQNVEHNDNSEPKRRYWYRSDASLRSLLSDHGAIESFRTWEFAAMEKLHYQFVVIRF